MVRLPVASDKALLEESLIEGVGLKNSSTESVQLDLSAQKDYIDWFSALQKTKEWKHYQEALAVFEASKSFEVKPPSALDLGSPFSDLEFLSFKSGITFFQSPLLTMQSILDMTCQADNTSTLSLFMKNHDSRSGIIFAIGVSSVPFLATGVASRPSLLVGAALVGACVALAAPVIKLKRMVNETIRAREKIIKLADVKTDVVVCLPSLSPMQTKLKSIELYRLGLLKSIESASCKMPSTLSASTQNSIHTTLEKLIDPLLDVQKGAMGLHQFYALQKWRQPTQDLIHKGYDLAFEMNGDLEIKRRLRNLSKNISNSPSLVETEDSNDLEDAVIIRKKPGAPK